MLERLRRWWWTSEGHKEHTLHLHHNLHTGDCSREGHQLQVPWSTHQWRPEMDPHTRQTVPVFIHTLKTFSVDSRIVCTFKSIHGAITVWSRSSSDQNHMDCLPETPEHPGQNERAQRQFLSSNHQFLSSTPSLVRAPDWTLDLVSFSQITHCFNFAPRFYTF